MEKHLNICQSCGMPLVKDPQGGGTNADQSISEKYCSFCYQNGVFLDEGISLEDKIAKNVKIAVKIIGMAEPEARLKAESIIPFLERWQ
ncbi:MAG: transcriptional regulator [Bacteroidetes bacterium HGW-Bacteroidetes-20]|nr:MAG: transcriptional regulator [Bacteroidetes bacterium HGW-Bacteroidetes-20]